MIVKAPYRARNMFDFRAGLGVPCWFADSDYFELFHAASSGPCYPACDFFDPKASVQPELV